MPLLVTALLSLVRAEELVYAVCGAGDGGKEAHTVRIEVEVAEAASAAADYKTRCVDSVLLLMHMEKR